MGDNSLLIIDQMGYDIDQIDRPDVADFETAIHYSKFGKFQKLLLAVCGTIYATCAISSTTLSFVLPSAKCDFRLTSSDKGKLSAMPLIGMIAGCSLWGSIADSQGRRLAIMLSLFVDFIAAIASSFVQKYSLFLICRFFSGFGIIGATSIVFSYLGEFVAQKHRDKLLGRLEVFWDVGVIILPGVAWILLNKNYAPDFDDNKGSSFSPWRIFVFVCSLPSLFSIILLYFLPETPKFLLTKKQYERAKSVFRKVYAFNTGESQFTYPITILEGEYENNNNNDKIFENIPLRLRFQRKINKFYEEVKNLISQSYLKYLGIILFADFGLMGSYYTLIMWFPEIFESFNQYEIAHPNKTASICIVLSSSSLLRQDSNDDWFEICDPTIDNRVFIDTIIVGLSCIPTSLSLSYFMGKFGKKTVLVFGLVLSGLSTLSLNWVQSSTETLVLSCIFEALASVLEAVLFCTVVDLFPTQLRAIAIAVTATTGRIGAIIGNVTFGALLDLNCVVPIYMIGTVLIASGVLCLLLPNSDNYILIH